MKEGRLPRPEFGGHRVDAPKWDEVPARVTIHTRALMARVEGQWHLITQMEIHPKGFPLRTVVTRCGLRADDPPERGPYMDVKPPPGIECEECVTLPPFWP